MKRILLKGNVITEKGVCKNWAVLISGNKIKEVGPARCIKVPKGTEIFDFKGKLISPGFIDLHVQGAGGADVLDATSDALNTISKTLAKFGTSSFLATTVFNVKAKRQPHLEAVDDAILNSLDGANVLGIHLEGPFVNPEKRGMIQRFNISKPSHLVLNKILSQTKGNLKMITIAPELKGALSIIARLKKEGVVASLGHSDASYKEALCGISNGISHATHIFNAMRPIHHRHPAAITALLLDGRVTVQVIADKVHIDPAVLRLIYRMKAASKIALITDSMSATGLADGRYIYNGVEYISKNGSARYKDGTLIGTTTGLNKMVLNMKNGVGATTEDAIKMASLVPARVLRIDKRKGSISVGKDADIAVFDKKMNCVMTIVGGKIVYQRRWQCLRRA